MFYLPLTLPFSSPDNTSLNAWPVFMLNIESNLPILSNFFKKKKKGCSAVWLGSISDNYSKPYILSSIARVHDHNLLTFKVRDYDRNYRLRWQFLKIHVLIRKNGIENILVQSVLLLLSISFDRINRLLVGFLTRQCRVRGWEVLVCRKAKRVCLK